MESSVGSGLGDLILYMRLVCFSVTLWKAVQIHFGKFIFRTFVLMKQQNTHWNFNLSTKRRERATNKTSVIFPIQGFNSICYFWITQPNQENELVLKFMLFIYWLQLIGQRKDWWTYYPLQVLTQFSRLALENNIRGIAIVFFLVEAKVYPAIQAGL